MLATNSHPETLRIKALIVAGAVLVLSITVAYVVAPDVIKNIWHSSKFSVVLLYAVFIPFVIFELLVHDRKQLASVIRAVRTMPEVLKVIRTLA